MKRSRCPLLPTGTLVCLAEVPPKDHVGHILLVRSPEPNRGVVVAIGPDVQDLRPGDDVLHKTLVRTVVTVDNRPWTLLKEGDVLARLNDR